MSASRLLMLDDAPVLAELLRASRDFLAPWEPIRSEDYFTADGQRAVIEDALGQHEHGSKLPHVIRSWGVALGAAVVWQWMGLLRRTCRE